MTWRGAASGLLAALGVALLGGAGFAWASAARYQRQAAADFARLAHPARGPAVPAAVAPGGIVGELEAPRLGLRVMVIEGDSDEVLRLGAGHVPGTSLPGRTGNVAIAAHRDTFFRPLQHVQVGDTINLTTLAASYRYRVTVTAIVAPSDVAVLLPTALPTLTLITCYPFYYVGPAPMRFIVSAVRIGGS